MKMSMTIRGFKEGRCNDVWDPVRLKCMIEGIDISDISDDTLDENILENYNNYRSDAVPAK